MHKYLLGSWVSGVPRSFWGVQKLQEKLKTQGQNLGICMEFISLPNRPCSQRGTGEPLIQQTSGHLCICVLDDSVFFSGNDVILVLLVLPQCLLIIPQTKAATGVNGFLSLPPTGFSVPQLGESKSFMWLSFVLLL